MKLAALVFCAVLAGPAREADASTFSVNPVQIYLSSKAPSTLLTVRNDSPQTLRFQLTAFTWDQTSREPLQLTPTDDVIFFPSLLTLAPKEERKIRIGTSASFGAVEKTYRIFVQEMPSLAKPGEQPSGVKVLTKMGIPIFLEASKVSAEATLDSVGVRNNKLSFQVGNRGNTHFVVEKIIVKGLANDGRIVLNRELSGWYVLAGRVHGYEFDIPAAECSSVASMAVEVRIGKNVFQEHVGAQPSACAP